MRTVKRFTSYEDLKAPESSTAEASITLKRHRAFEKLVAVIRAHMTRKGDRSRG